VLSCARFVWTAPTQEKLMATSDDIVDVLLEEHDDFRGIFDELDGMTPDEREDLFTYLVARLASHEAAEEAIVHRAMRDEIPDGGRVANAVLEEEASAEKLLAEMTDLDPTSEEFTRALERLREDVLAHAEHEEADEFPRLRAELDLERRREMGRRFQKVRDAGPTRPHPMTPQNPTVRAAVGPIAGAFDRARDLVRDTLRD
jgi:hypothetical protein